MSHSDCNGCHRPITFEQDYILFTPGKGSGPCEIYHKDPCWQTGWYTGIEPEGEWPLVPKQGTDGVWRLRDTEPRGSEPIYDHFNRGERRTTSRTGGEKSWRKPRPTHRVDPLSLAWVAGIVEGEGSFYLKNPRSYPSPIFQVSMCDLDVIERAHGIMQVGNIKIKKPGPRSVKDQYQWRVTPQAEVAWVMDMLYPLMGERRRAKIDELREYIAPWAKGE